MNLKRVAAFFFYVHIYLFTTCSITNSNTTCLERSSYTFYIIYISFLLNLIVCQFVYCLVFSAYGIVEMYWFILSLYVCGTSLFVTYLTVFARNGPLHLFIVNRV